MTWIRNISTEYHQQDTDYYCGGAVAQMILDSIGAGLLDQDVLYNSNHSHNTVPGWSTDPDGLNYTLNYYKPDPPTFNNYFVVYAMDSELEGEQENRLHIMALRRTHWDACPWLRSLDSCPWRVHEC